MLRMIVGFVALAVVLGTAQAKGFYVTGSFGPNWDEGAPFAFVDEETGFAGAIAVGTHVQSVDGLRLELEASFRSHDITAFGFIPLEHDTTAVMVNAVYDVKGLAMGRVTPYALLGAGYVGTELTLGGVGPLTIENDGFAWQVGGGLNYQIDERVSAGVGYRYLEAPAVDVFGFELDGGGNHSVLAHVTVALD